MTHESLIKCRLWRDNRGKERSQYRWAQRNTAQLIAETMQVLGITTQNALAVQLKVSPSVLSRMVKGQQPPGAAFLERLIALTDGAEC